MSIDARGRTQKDGPCRSPVSHPGAGDDELELLNEMTREGG
jgi:hypothetical protein